MGRTHPRSTAAAARMRGRSARAGATRWRARRTVASGSASGRRRARAARRARGGLGGTGAPGLGARRPDGLDDRRFVVAVVVVLLVGPEPEVEHGLAPHAIAIAASSFARLTRLGRDGRGPNSAVPTRTMVAPSATATSRSSVMPIDRSARPRSSRQAGAARRERGAGPVGVARRGDAIRPRTSSPRSPQRRSTRSAACVGRAAALLGSPVTFTCTSTAAPGARLAISAPSDAPVDALPQADVGASWPHLVALEAADEVPAGRRASPTAPALATSSWA